MVIGLFLSLLTINNNASAQEMPIVSQYAADNGIEIISYVETWQDSMLADLGAELKNNKHGVEMEYLDRIEIYPGLEPGGDTNISASYQKEEQQVSIPINLTGFLPKDYALSVNVEKGVINIYQGDEKKTVEDIALDLSHEYGHHFTFFYFGDSFSVPEEYKKSPYYEARQIQDFKQVNGESSYEDNLHRWSIYEIAAEDYKQLLGSKTGKGITDFSDISEKIGQNTYQPINPVSRRDYNVIPQENSDIPLAFQVPGLAEYFYSFLDEEISNDIKTHELPTLLYRAEDNNGFRKGTTLEWKPIDWADDITYTLVAFNEENQIIPIRTVYPGEEMSAIIGTVTNVEDKYVYYYQDGLDHGILRFKLYMQFPNGNILVSEALTVEFGD